MSQSTVPSDLAERVRQVIAKTQHIPAEIVTLDSTFEQLKIDSLDGINIVFALETEFGVDVPDESAKNLRSIRDVVDGVAALLAAKGSQPDGGAPSA